MGSGRSAQGSKRRRYVRGAHRFKRGDWWCAWIPGVGRVALGTKDDAEAEREFRRQVTQGKARARPAEETLEVIVDAYIDAPHGWSKRTKSSAEYRAVTFQEAMAARGVTLPSQITTAVLDAWRSKAMETSEAATINRAEDVVRKMLRWAAEQSPPMCGPTPMAQRKRLKESKREGRRVVPSPIDAAAIADVLDAPDGHRGLALAVRLACSAGQRLDELRHLDDDAIDDDGVRVRPEEGAAAETWKTKNRTERKIPLPPEVVARAREFVAWRDEHDWQMADGWISELLERACRIAEIPEDLAESWGMHDFRRTFATAAVRAGVPLTTVQDWLGHCDVRTTQRYLGVYRTDATETVPSPAAVAILAAKPADVVSIAASGGGDCPRGQSHGGALRNQRPSAASHGARNPERRRAQDGGGTGIRTLGGLSPSAVFKTADVGRKDANSIGAKVGGQSGGQSKGGRPVKLGAGVSPNSARAPQKQASGAGKSRKRTSPARTPLRGGRG